MLLGQWPLCNCVKQFKRSPLNEKPRSLRQKRTQSQQLKKRRLLKVFSWQSAGLPGRKSSLKRKKSEKSFLCNSKRWDSLCPTPCAIIVSWWKWKQKHCSRFSRSTEKQPLVLSGHTTRTTPSASVKGFTAKAFWYSPPSRSLGSTERNLENLIGRTANVLPPMVD